MISSSCASHQTCKRPHLPACAKPRLRRRPARTHVQMASSQPAPAAQKYLKLQEYVAPPYAAHLKVPKSRYGLAILPTPVHPWHLPGLPEGVQVWIKRDDLTGMQMSGNKVRKLEFLMAEALQNSHDTVITIGGIQSNHCRATAVAARLLGLHCHLILRVSRQQVDQDPQLVGNLLVDRMVGATIHKVTKEEYTRVGSERLGEILADKLRAEGMNPYVIPVGGSNSLGCWGYLNAVAEMEQDLKELGITDIAMACGSGGTTAGTALGVYLAKLEIKVHAMGVCDDPDYFYTYIDGLLQGMGAAPDVIGTDARGMLEAVQARGSGYAISTASELVTCRDVALQTGILLDPVYTGKAVHVLLQDIQSRPEHWKGRRLLFIHTGGLLGMYDKVDQLQPLMEEQQAVVRLKVD